MRRRLVVGAGKSGNLSQPLARGSGVSASSAEARLIEIPDILSVKQLGDLLKVSAIDIIKRLMRDGIMVSVNQTIDYQSAAKVATTFGYEAQRQAPLRKSVGLLREIKKRQEAREVGGLEWRPPVVTVMGHVDHGKTRLLDAIRSTNVMATEAGGITQRIGAYQVEVGGQKITFLDTPGHEAFTAMRARGAQVTDIAVLVVAADDGVMPQTLEAINHARAAGVPILVAINKIDKPEANPELVKRQLAEAGLVVEEWGGDTVCVLVSAREGQGIAQLLESLLIVAEMEELKADPSRPAEGVVLEAKLDKTKGAVATVLVHDGSLRVGDAIVVGDIWGKVKAMFSDAGKQVRRAGPSLPVEVLGLNSVPQAGATLIVVTSDHEARVLVTRRQQEAVSSSPRPVSLSNLYEQISAGRVRELNVVLKTDLQGSIEAIRSALEQLATEEVKVRIIHSSSGNISESDIMLALASKGIIIVFNAGVEPGVRALAEREGVSIRHYDVIYNLVDDVGKALKGMLKPSKVEIIEGRAEVRAVFPAVKRQRAAGLYVSEGTLRRDASVRVRRGQGVVCESKVVSLRRFKDDVREVTAGYECGLVVENFGDFTVGDLLEFFRIEEAV